ncbi:MAG: hypothetical protein EB084_06915 [Proteobacteria bacterium]|nr:hypothetical protein [Pseudomonadota bacterium]
MQLISMISMFTPQQSSPAQGMMGAIVQGGCFSQGEAMGNPMGELVSLSKMAMRMLSGANRRHAHGHRHHFHHVRPQASKMGGANTNRAQGLQREIQTLHQQLAQYAQKGDSANAAATMALIARDQQMQVAAMQGLDV